MPNQNLVTPDNAVDEEAVSWIASASDTQSQTFKNYLASANLATLLAAHENIRVSATKKKRLEPRIKQLTKLQDAQSSMSAVESDNFISATEEAHELTFESNMTKAEAQEKHGILKATVAVIRTLLLDIRDRKGYLHLGYKSFDEYGEKEFGLSKSHINRLATAAAIQKNVSPIGDMDIPESQLRPLGQVPEPERAAIFKAAQEQAIESGKKLTAQMVENGVAEWKAKAEAAQTTIFALEEAKGNAEKAFNELEATVDAKADLKAREKIAEAEKNANQQLAIAEAELQQTIDKQQDTIDSLTSKIASIEQTSCTTDTDKEMLEDLHAQIDQANATLKALTIDQKQANAAKRENHAYMGIAAALARDAHDHIENMNSISHLVDDNGNAIPLYPLTDDSKDYLQEAARVLRNSAKFLENLAAYSDSTPEFNDGVVDGVDLQYESLSKFLKKWKAWKKRQEPLKSGGNDYDWWSSRLREEQSEKIRSLIHGFPQVWERYHIEIQASD